MTPRVARCVLSTLLMPLVAACEGQQWQDITPDRALHAEFVGCWRLALRGNAGGITAPPFSPMQIRLDTATFHDASGAPGRVVRRLNAEAVPVTTDADGAPLSDAWYADAAGARLRLRFDNGRVGSTWLLDATRDSLGGVWLTGLSQGFNRATPSAPYPKLSVVASPIVCARS